MRDFAYELTDSSHWIAIVTPANLHDLPHLVREDARLYENRKPGGQATGLWLKGDEKGPLITQHRCSVPQTAEVNHQSLGMDFDSCT